MSKYEIEIESDIPPVKKTKTVFSTSGFKLFAERKLVAKIFTQSPFRIATCTGIIRKYNDGTIWAGVGRASKIVPAVGGTPIRWIDMQDEQQFETVEAAEKFAFDEMGKRVKTLYANYS